MIKRILVLLTLCTSLNATATSLLITGILSEYYDPDSELPIAQPAEGTIFSLSLTYDENATDILDYTPTGLSPGTSLNNSLFSRSALISAELSFAGNVFNLYEQGVLVIQDNVESQDGSYYDTWYLQTEYDIDNSDPDNIYEQGFGVSFYSSSDSANVAPLTTADLEPPTASGWDDAVIFFRRGYEIATEDGTRSENSAYVQADIISVQAVPIPSALWLFCSALIGLAGIKRRA